MEFSIAIPRTDQQGCRVLGNLIGDSDTSMFAMIAQHNGETKSLQHQQRNLKINRPCQLSLDALTNILIEASTRSVLPILSGERASDIDHTISHRRKRSRQSFPMRCFATHGDDSLNLRTCISLCWGTRHRRDTIHVHCRTVMMYIL